jgi:hypothetical protein
MSPEPTAHAHSKRRAQLLDTGLHGDREAVERRSGRRLAQQSAYVGIAGQRLFTICAACEVAGDLLHLMRREFAIFEGPQERSDIITLSHDVGSH